MENLSKQRITIAACALLGIMAAFLPWVSVSIFRIKHTIGFQYGVISFLFFIPPVVLAILGDRSANLTGARLKAALITAGISGLWGLAKIFLIFGEISKVKKMGAPASIGVGPFLTLLCAAALIAGAIIVPKKFDKLNS